MTRTYSGARADRPSAELSALELDQLLEHFVGSRDRLGVGRERALMLNHADELGRQVDVRAFQRATGGRTAATATGGTERGSAALARRDPQVLTSAAEAVVGAELGDTELRHGDLLAVRVQAGHDALAVDRHAGEVTRRIAVLLLRGHVRGTRELRGAVEARAAFGDRGAEVERDGLRGSRAAAEGGGDGRGDGLGVERAVRGEGERTAADFRVTDDRRIHIRAGDEHVVIPRVVGGLAEVNVRAV